MKFIEVMVHNYTEQVSKQKENHINAAFIQNVEIYYNEHKEEWSIVLKLLYGSEIYGIYGNEDDAISAYIKLIEGINAPEEIYYKAK